MNKLLIAFMGLILSMSLGLSGAYAKQYSMNTSKDQGMSSSAKEHRVARESGRFVTKATASEYKANDIIGAKVENRQEKKLGTIKDLAVDPKTDKVAFAVIGRGIGEKDVAVPLKSLSLRTDENGKIKFFVLNMSEDQLANAPSFDNDSWAGMRSAEKSSRTYGQSSTWSGKKESTTPKSETREPATKE